MNVPIGSLDFTTNYMTKQAAKRTHRLICIHDLLDAHVLFTLTRMFMNASQLNYHLRTVHPTLSSMAATLYDQAIGDSPRSLAGGTLSEATIDELFLPVRIDDPGFPHFEVGLTSAHHSRAAAYVASRATIQLRVKELTQHAPTPTSHLLSSTSDTHSVRTAVLRVSDQLDDHLHEPYRSFTSFDIDLSDDRTSSTAFTQHALMDKINTTRIRRITPVSSREDGYRRAQALPGAKDWLRTPPSPALGTRLSNRKFRTWFQFYCRCPLFNPSSRRQCIQPNCSKDMGIFGDHLLVCAAPSRSAFSPAIRRHDTQVRLLAADLTQACRAPKIEPRLPSVTDSSRPDILALGRHGAEYVIDVAFAHDWKLEQWRTPQRRSIQAVLLSRAREKRTQHMTFLQHHTRSQVVPIILSAAGVGYKNHTTLFDMPPSLLPPES